MWPTRATQLETLVERLQAARVEIGLNGLPDLQTIDTLSMQFIASLRREDYYRLVQQKAVAAHRADPNSPTFDAERAAAYYVQQGNIDEAGWLIFLMTHFARRADTQWLRLKDVYGRLGAGVWNWPTVSDNPAAFYQWLDSNWQKVRGAFGNHRKYESLNPNANRPMSRTVADYLQWIGSNGHAAFFAQAVRSAGNDPHTIFDYLYETLNVRSFGRLAKFDYLSLIGRYGLAPITPGLAYLAGATGPARGARLLIDGNPTSDTPTASLQNKLSLLDQFVNVGMVVMEDALCNWQKSPRQFVHYQG